MKIKDMTREQFSDRFEKYLRQLLSGARGLTGDAMRYASLDGGKRVRPLCVYYGAKAMGGNADADQLLPAAAATELIHSYSLVHDDMPEMDNDDYRRGKPSTHKKYGASIALLAGDGLLTLAGGELLKLEKNVAGEINSAALDMVYGQSRELEGCKSIDEFLNMYAQKTGALIRGAFRAGALCASAGDDMQTLMAQLAKCLENDDAVYNIGELNVDDGKAPKKLATVTCFAENLGIAFQLADDLLEGSGLIYLIGKEEEQKLLDKHTALAMECAKDLECSDELINFAQELWRRKA